MAEEWRKDNEKSEIITDVIEVSSYYRLPDHSPIHAKLQNSKSVRRQSFFPLVVRSKDIFPKESDAVVVSADRRSAALTWRLIVAMNRIVGNDLPQQ